MMCRILLLFALIVAPGCCTHDAAIVSINRGIAGNAGHMEDVKLPQEARDIATDSHDVFHQIKFALEGTKVPAAVQARKDARDAAKKAAEGGGE